MCVCVCVCVCVRVRGEGEIEKEYWYSYIPFCRSIRVPSVCKTTKNAQQCGTGLSIFLMLPLHSKREEEGDPDIQPCS